MTISDIYKPILNNLIKYFAYHVVLHTVVFK